MAAHEIENKGDRTESRESNNISSLAPELFQNGSIRQLNKVESAATITNNGFPQMDLFDGSAVMKADSTSHALRLSSKYETGGELTSDRELKQAGLDPKHVKHTLVNNKDGGSDESTTVKYPSGIEVTVSGSTRHTSHNTDIVMDPSATIKEPLPKGYHKDKDGAILDSSNKKVAEINDDGTVTIKVGKQWVTQSPAGVTEAVVFDHGRGMAGRLKLKD